MTAAQNCSSGTRELREKAADAIRTFCQSLSPAAVQMSGGQERIYYSGLSLDALSVAVALAIPPQAQADNHIEHTAAGVIDWKMEVERLNRRLGAAQRAESREVVWLREVDAGTDNACWVISNRVDPSSVPFFMGSAYSLSSTDREGA